MAIPSEYWSNLEAKAPIQLTQSYYECYPSSDAAFFNALGIASGNTQLAVPMVVFITIPLLYLLLVLIRQVPPPREEYTRTEKEQALEILSIILLRLRDGKSRGIKPKGVLMTLTNELISAAKEEVGYPDSDDEGDDDDEDGLSPAAMAMRYSRSAAKSTLLDDDDDDNGDDSKVDDMTMRKIKSVNVTIDCDDEENADDNNYQQRPTTSKPSKPRRTTVGKRRSNTKNVPQKKKSAVAANINVPIIDSTIRTRQHPRSKLAIFTKHLEEKDTGENNRMSFAGGSDLKKRNMSITGSFDTAPASAGFLQGWFGSSSTAQVNPSQQEAHQEMVTFNAQLGAVALLPEIRNAGAPAGVTIVNELGSGERLSVRPPRGTAQIQTLIEDLLREVTVAFADRPRHASPRDKTNKSESYSTARALSHRLQIIDIDEFLAMNDPVLCLKLSNAMHLQASLLLGCELSAFEKNDGSEVKIAYNIGGRLVTAAALLTLV